VEAEWGEGEFVAVGDESGRGGVWVNGNVALGVGIPRVAVGEAAGGRGSSVAVEPATGREFCAGVGVAVLHAARRNAIRPQSAMIFLGMASLVDGVWLNYISKTILSYNVFHA